MSGNGTRSRKGKATARRRKLSPEAAKWLPYPEFPLSPHLASGQWYKTHQGVRHYFGKLDDPDAAYERYEREWPQIIAGRKPRPENPGQQGGGLTLREGVNLWLAARVEDGEAGVIAASTVEGYRRIARRLMDELGGTTRISWLGPDDFRRLANTYRAKMAASPAKKAMTVTRMVFTWLYQNEHIPAPPRYGSDFKLGKLQGRRVDRGQRNASTFTAEQVRTLLDAAEHGVESTNTIEGVKASPHIRAMVMLAINGGYTQRELATLRLDDVDLDSAIIDHYRGKSEARRTVPLWPETVEAIKASLAKRATPKPEAEGLLFVSIHGNPWHRETMKVDKPEHEGGKEKLRYQRVDKIGHQFAKLCKAARVNVKGAGFGHLRHTHRTASDEANDPHAAMRIMGHDVPGISRHYVNEISHERLRAVSEHVRAWLGLGEDEQSPAVAGRIGKAG